MYYIKAKARKNSKTYSKTLAKLATIDDTIAYLAKNSLSITDKPYIFTHLGLSDGTILTQGVDMGCGLEVPCSPTKLLEEVQRIIPSLILLA